MARPIRRPASPNLSTAVRDIRWFEEDIASMAKLWPKMPMEERIRYGGMLREKALRCITNVMFAESDYARAK